MTEYIVTGKVNKKCKVCLFRNRDGICTMKDVEVKGLDLDEVEECWFFRDGDFESQE